MNSLSERSRNPFKRLCNKKRHKFFLSLSFVPGELADMRGVASGVLALFLCFNAGVEAHASDNIQSAGDILQFVLPAAAAGLTLDNVVATTVYLLDVNDFTGMNAAYANLFSKPFPARATIQVAALPKKGALVEISAIAVDP